MRTSLHYQIFPAQLFVLFEQITATDQMFPVPVSGPRGKIGDPVNWRSGDFHKRASSLQGVKAQVSSQQHHNDQGYQEQAQPQVGFFNK